METINEVITTSVAQSTPDQVFARLFDLAKPWTEKASNVNDLSSLKELWALASTISIQTEPLDPEATMDKRMLWRRAARHIRQTQVLEGGPPQTAPEIKQRALEVLALCCFDAQWQQSRILNTPAVPICIDFPAALFSKDAFFRDKHVPGHIDFPELSYQIDEDKAILRENVASVAASFPDTVVLIEFGVDATAKTILFLDEIARQRKVCYYVAVDRSIKALRDHLGVLTRTRRSRTAIRGWRGEFSDAYEAFDKLPGPRVFLSLGSTLLDDPEPEKCIQPLERYLREGDMLYMSHDSTDMSNTTKIKSSYAEPHFLNLVGGGLLSMDGYDPKKWKLDHQVRAKGPLTRHSFTLENHNDPEKKYRLFESVKFSPQYAQQMCLLRPLSITRIYEKEKVDMCHYIIKPVSYLTFIARAAAIRNPVVLDNDTVDFAVFELRFKQDPVDHLHKMLGVEERTDLVTLLERRRPYNFREWPHGVPNVEPEPSTIERNFRVCPRIGATSLFASAIVFGNLCGRQGIWPPEFRTFDQMMTLTELVSPSEE